MIDLLLLFVIKVFQTLLRLVPERLSRAFGVTLGRAAYLILRDRRRVAITNALRILPEVSPRWARAVARQCFERLGTNFVEILLFPFLTEDECNRRFCLEVRGGSREILASRQGALVLGFHYSNWEIMGIASRLLGRDIIALARPLKRRPALNTFVVALREATGLTIIPNRDTARDVMRLLRDGKLVAFLGDQREKKSKAVWAELFGQKVPTSKGVIALAMKTGAPVIPIYSRREGFLRYTVICDEPLVIERTGASKDELIYRNARSLNALLERVVGEHPEEWFLVHRRFGRRKRPHRVRKGTGKP